MKKMDNENFKWLKEINEDTQLILTDDIDSLLSCFIIGEQTGAKIRNFYSFNEYYKHIGYGHTDNIVGVDLDLAVGKCFSNHVTPYNNPLCFGFNQMIDTQGQNYFNKYAGSTAIMLLWFYDYDFSKFTEEQIKILISIDSGFIQYYKYRDKWNIWYNDLMQIGQYIEPVLEKTTMNELEQMQRRLKMKSKIVTNEFMGNSIGFKFQRDIKLDYIKEVLSPIFNNIDNLKLPNNIYIKSNMILKTEEGNFNKLNNRMKTHNIISWAKTGYKKFKYTYAEVL